jgi:class 3 adenylate cyclase
MKSNQHSVPSFFDNLFGIEAIDKFVPKEFIKRIAPDGLEFLKFGKADTDFISILFCDIRSFTSLSEKMSPQELVDFLNDFFKRMTEPISNNKGFVDKFIGDGVMALFSIPEEPNAADALNSVIAAISMQQQIDSFNKDNKMAEEKRLRIGIGIHSGPVIIGTVGSEERMESTVTGDTVNLASRLEGLTKFYRSKILISQSTYEFIDSESSFEFRELDLVKVKGKDKPVTIFEVCNSDPEPIREQKLGSREKFAEALKDYRSQKWTAAMTKFKNCLKECPDDGASELHLERCKSFKKTPPPKDWKGEQVFTQK